MIGSALIAETVQLRAVTNEFKSTVTTLFWVGEPSDAENAFIPNDVSYWDKDWQLNYGGVDDPDNRNGFWPQISGQRKIPFTLHCPTVNLNRHAVTIFGATLKISLGTAAILLPSSRITGSRSSWGIGRATRSGKMWDHSRLMILVMCLGLH